MTQTTALAGATALIGTELRVVHNAVVVIEGGRIAAAGTRSELRPPPDAAQIDAAGLVLTPGFIDTHVHLGFFEPGVVLRHGVTTVRDLAWPPDEIFPLARRSHADEFEGPTVLAAGPMLTVAGGYPTRAAWAPPGTGAVVRDTAHARALVDEIVDRGACVVKVALNAAVGPTLNTDTLNAIVDAAHARGRRVTGHVTGLNELRKAIQCGLDELAHMLMSDEPIPQAVIKDMVAADMTVVPTLSIRFGSDQQGAIANLMRFLDHGGRVIYGTDLGNQGPEPGIDAREVAALNAAGMSPLDVVAAATTRAAEWLELVDRGAIAPGARADLVAFEEAALTDPAALASPRMVWRAGRRIV